MPCGPRWRRWPGWWSARRAGGAQLLDRLQVVPGYEKALGAALADDLRAPEVAAEGAVGLGRAAGL